MCQWIKWHTTVSDYKELIENAVIHGLITPLKRGSLIPYPSALGAQLDNCIITVDEFRAFAASLHVEVPEVLTDARLAKVEARQAGAPAAPVEDVKEGETVSVNSGTTGGSDWTAKARAIADELFDHDTECGCRDSLKNYSKRVMNKMQERGIKGPRGIIDNAATVMRDALQGGLWWARKAK